MKNREKYAEIIKGFVFKKNENWNVCNTFIRPVILKNDDCSDIGCVSCRLYQSLWFDEEYVEEEEVVDWSKVEKGTMIEVTDKISDGWNERRLVGVCSDRFVCESRASSNWLVWKYARLIK